MLNRIFFRVLYYFVIILLLFVLVPPQTLAAQLTDDFNDGNMDNWIRVDDPNRIPCSSSWVENNGVIGISISQLSCTTNLMPTDSFWNNLGNEYQIDVDVQFVSGTDHNVAFRFTPSAPSNDWYDIHFTSPNGFTLERVPSGQTSNSVTYYLPNKTEFYHIKIIVITGNIKIYIDDNLALDYIYNASDDYFPAGRFAFRAGTGSNPISETYFDNLIVRSIDEVEPQGNVPVVLVPGFGGSWNTSDIVTGGSSDGWKKTPFIKVYDNIKSTFLDNGGYTEGDDYFEFYYDWRKPADSIAESFGNFIDNTVLAGKPAGTKVNLVGHSFGGVISRVYAQKFGYDKINKLVTSGSPHEGAISAWQAWSGAEVGDRWSWQWIALQLYLQIHKDNYTSPIDAIQDLAPSLNNLTPIFDFAKDSSNQVISVSAMNSFNRYLADLNSSIDSGLKDLMSTIAGNENTIADSIEWIKLGDRNLSDRLLGKWIDGKPVGYEYTDYGDLTVLEKSALISDTDQAVVSANHIELMESNEGIQTILNTLGLSGFSPANVSSSPNRNPALVFFLHSPANIKVTAPDGTEAGYGVASPMSNSIYSEADKLLVVFDAVEGEYDLEVIGTGNGDYSLDVGQLTEEGEEWSSTQDKINSGETDHYVLEFNSNHPKDFPLIDVSGKMQLNLAKEKFLELKDYINSQSFSKAYKKQLIKEIDKIMVMIDRAIDNIDRGKYLISFRYAKAAMTGSYSFRIKVDRLGQKGRISDEVKAKIKILAHQAGLYSLEGYVATLDQSGKGFNQNRANREIGVAEKIKVKVEGRISSSGENHVLGQAFNLCEELLEESQESLSNGEYSKAGAQALVSRLLGLESSKIM